MKKHKYSVFEFFYDTSFSDYRKTNSSRFSLICFYMLWFCFFMVFGMYYLIFETEFKIKTAPSAIEEMIVRYVIKIFFTIFLISLQFHLFSYIKHFLKFKNFNLPGTTSPGPR